MLNYLQKRVTKRPQLTLFENTILSPSLLFWFMKQAQSSSKHVTLSKCRPNINVTHHHHFTLVYLFGITRLRQTRERIKNRLQMMFSSIYVVVKFFYFIFILRLYLICQSCLNGYNLKLLGRSCQLDSHKKYKK